MSHLLSFKTLQTLYNQNGSLLLRRESLRQVTARSTRYRQNLGDCTKVRWLSIHFAWVLKTSHRSRRFGIFLIYCRSSLRLRRRKRLKIPYCSWSKCLFCQRIGSTLDRVPRAGLSLKRASACQNLYRNNRHPTERRERQSFLSLQVTQKGKLVSKSKAKESNCQYLTMKSCTLGPKVVSSLGFSP